MEKWIGLLFANVFHLFIHTYISSCLKPDDVNADTTLFFSDVDSCTMNISFIVYKKVWVCLLWCPHRMSYNELNGEVIAPLLPSMHKEEFIVPIITIPFSQTHSSCIWLTLFISSGTYDPYLRLGLSSINNPTQKYLFIWLNEIRRYLLIIYISILIN